MITTEPITTDRTGHLEMYKWNPTWKHCDLPRWAQKPLRAYIKWLEACNESAVNTDMAMWFQCKYSGFVDHWGSIEDSRGQRVLLMCSHYRHDGVLEEIAKIINAECYTCTRCAWDSSLLIYTFKP